MKKSLDAELIISIQNGDKKAFDKLFRKYYLILRDYARQLTHNVSVAEDIVQDLFYTLWTKQNEISGIKSIGAYLRISVHNRCITYLKKNSSFVSEDIDKWLSAECDSLQQEIFSYRDDDLEREELSLIISETIESLPEQCRKVFKLSRNFGLKNAEIANHLGISVKAVEKHISKALNIIRQSIKYLILLFFY